MKMSSTLAFKTNFKDTNTKSTSESNIPSLKNFNDELPLNDSEKNQEKLETMKVRKEALEETLEKKLNELRAICLREGELTGFLPKEFPLKKNEELPVIRRKVRTEFTFSDKLLMQPKTKDEEKLTQLELEFEIQCKIVKATSKLCNEINAKKSIKKQRKQVHQQALAKLKDIEKNLQITKKNIEENAKKSKKQSSINFNDIAEKELTSSDTSSYKQTNKNSNYSLNEMSDEDTNSINLKYRKNFNYLSKDTIITFSEPSTPAKNIKRCENEIKAINKQPNEFTFVNSRIDSLSKQRCSYNNSPEYDTISLTASSLGSSNNLFYNNYCKAYKKLNEVNNYEELCKNSPESEAKKIFGVPTRRSAIAPNLSQDDINLIKRKQNINLLKNEFYIEKYKNLKIQNSLTRHNSLDRNRRNFLKNEYNEILDRNESFNNLNANMPISPNIINFQTNFNFQSNSSLALDIQKSLKSSNKSQSNINMAQRPLPSPPVDAQRNKKSNTENIKKETNLLNLGNLANSSEQIKIKNFNNYQSSLLLNPIKSPSTVSMLQQSPLDFEKANNLYKNKQNSSLNILKTINSSTSNINSINLDTKSFNKIENESKIKPVRSSVVRTPVALTINTCSSDLQLQNNPSQHSPVPLLPPRTPITNKPNPINSMGNLAMNSNSSLNSFQISNFSNNILSSSTNLSHKNSNSNLNNNKVLNEKSSKCWAETNSENFQGPSNFKIVQNQNCFSMINDQEINQSNYSNFKEKENQFCNSNVPIRNKPFSYNSSVIDNSSSNNLQNNIHQVSSINNSNSNLSSSSSTKNLVGSQVFQPFHEEVKPYELSDFYKYSQKHRKKAINECLNNENLKVSSNNVNQSLSDFNLDKSKEVNTNVAVKQESKNEANTYNDNQSNTTLSEDSFLIKSRVAEAFSDEMNAWYEEKYKTATLV